MKVRIDLTPEQWDLLVKFLKDSKDFKRIGERIELAAKRKQKQENYNRQVSGLESKLVKHSRKSGLKILAEEYRENLIKKQTKAEVITKAVLKSLDIKYDFQKIFYNLDTFYIADFYIPYYNIVIELDGEYHEDEIQRSKDLKRDKILKTFNGVSYVGRIENSYTANTIKLANKIKAIIEYSKKVK